MKAGDRIAIKSSYTRKYGVPFRNNGKAVSVMAIKARGIIKKNPENGRRVEVAWEKCPKLREWYSFTCRQTIWRVFETSPLRKELIDFAFEDARQDYGELGCYTDIYNFCSGSNPFEQANNEQLHSYYGFVEEIESTSTATYAIVDMVSQRDLALFWDKINKFKNLSRPDERQYQFSRFLFRVRSRLMEICVEKSKLANNVQRTQLIKGRWHKFSAGREIIAHNCSTIGYRNSLHLSHPQTPTRSSTDVKWLEHVFSLESIAYASEKTIQDVLDISEISSVICYNVGQGSCSASCNAVGKPLVYYDFGGGFGRNRHTYPKNIRFCLDNQPVILSHWDMDHWVSGSHPVSRDILKSPWIVPDQGPMGVKARQFAEKIYRKGSLLVWPAHISKIESSVGTLLKLPYSSNRNHSGIVVLAKGSSSEAVLLPGDAAYSKIPLTYPEFTSIVASHHGGWYKGDKVPITSLRRLAAFSYGKGNSYGHPTSTSVRRHRKGGWGFRYRTPSGHILLTKAVRGKFCTSCTAGCTLQPVQP